jgi:hypothetical protein
MIRLVHDDDSLDALAPNAELLEILDGLERER